MHAASLEYAEAAGMPLLAVGRVTLLVPCLVPCVVHIAFPGVALVSNRDAPDMPRTVVAAVGLRVCKLRPSPAAPRGAYPTAACHVANVGS
jgi:hypothetical protein